jgi:hypothetical protein
VRDERQRVIRSPGWPGGDASVGTGLYLKNDLRLDLGDTNKDPLPLLHGNAFGKWQFATVQ